MKDVDSKQVNTPYGTVNATVLQTLQDSYDTPAILRMVDRLDAIRARFDGIDGARDDLLRLHAMAHTVLNGARPVAPSDETPIWEAADELVSALQNWSSTFAAFAEQLRPLIDLVPDEERMK